MIDEMGSCGLLADDGVKGKGKGKRVFYSGHSIAWHSITLTLCIVGTTCRIGRHGKKAKTERYICQANDRIEKEVKKNDGGVLDSVRI